MLGIRPGFEGLVIDPCIPAEWKEFKVVRQWRGATFNISVKNPDGAQKGILSITLDGKTVKCPIPPQPVGSINEIVATMGG